MRGTEADGNVIGGETEQVSSVSKSSLDIELSESVSADKNDASDATNASNENETNDTTSSDNVDMHDDDTKQSNEPVPTSDDETMSDVEAHVSDDSSMSENQESSVDGAFNDMPDTPPMSVDDEHSVEAFDVTDDASVTSETEASDAEIELPDVSEATASEMMPKLDTAMSDDTVEDATSGTVGVGDTAEKRTESPDDNDDAASPDAHPHEVSQSGNSEVAPSPDTPASDTARDDTTDVDTQNDTDKTTVIVPVSSSGHVQPSGTSSDKLLAQIQAFEKIKELAKSQKEAPKADASDDKQPDASAASSQGKSQHEPKSDHASIDKSITVRKHECGDSETNADKVSHSSAKKPQKPPQPVRSTVERIEATAKQSKQQSDKKNASARPQQQPVDTQKPKVDKNMSVVKHSQQQSDHTDEKPDADLSVVKHGETHKPSEQSMMIHKARKSNVRGGQRKFRKPSFIRHAAVASVGIVAVCSMVLGFTPIGNAFAQQVEAIVTHAVSNDAAAEQARKEQLAKEAAEAKAKSEEEARVAAEQEKQEAAIEAYTQLLLSQQENSNVPVEDTTSDDDTSDEDEKAAQEAAEAQALKQAQEQAQKAKNNAEQAQQEAEQQQREYEKEAQDRQRQAELAAQSARAEAERQLAAQEAAELEAKSEWESAQAKAAEARQKKLDEEASIRAQNYRNVVEIEGNYVNYTYQPNIAVAPAKGCAAWKNHGDVNDDEGTYFVGHNPGPFTCVMSLRNGDRVTVWDNDGNARTYHVVDVFDVSRSTMFLDIVDRTMNRGESVTLQTCKNSAQYRIVVALPAETE